MKKIIVLLIVLFIICGCSNENVKNEVNVLNWSSYIPYSIIDDFERETGIKVNYGTYSSNEELLAKISSSNEGVYDLIFPSDYMIDLMIGKDMIEKIDIKELENFKNINPMFLNQDFDKNNEYSLPFLAATSVIAVNRNNIKDEINSYNDLLNSKYKNNIVLIDDQRIIVGMSLLANNYDMNDIDKNHIEEGKKWLLKLNNNVKAFDSDSPKTFLITNEVDIGVIWNAEAIIAKNYNKNIEIVYPKDGFALSLDNYAIVKCSRNKKNAYKFIDYLLREDINKKITEEYPYINTTISGINMKTEELLNVLKNSTYVKNIGSSISLYDKVWAQIK